MLHVGDRWELDVVGARAAGCGAVLYRGLWGTYPAGLYGELPPPPADRGGVRLVDSLVELAAPTLWRGPASLGR
jgi:FMN phosphatase YigB (HAD superfamily)